MGRARQKKQMNGPEYRQHKSKMMDDGYPLYPMDFTLIGQLRACDIRASKEELRGKTVDDEEWPGACVVASGFRETYDDIEYMVVSTTKVWTKMRHPVTDELAWFYGRPDATATRIIKGFDIDPDLLKPGVVFQVYPFPPSGLEEYKREVNRRHTKKKALAILRGEHVPNPKKTPKFSPLEDFGKKVRDLRGRAPTRRRS